MTRQGHSGPDPIGRATEIEFSQAHGGAWTLTHAPPICVEWPGPAQWSDGFLSIHANELAPERFRLGFGDEASFNIDLASRQICVASAVHSSEATLRHLLFDQVLPRLLAQEPGLVLHAAGIEVAKEAVLFVGSSGSGKSTLSASFHLAGFQLLSDDALMVWIDDDHAVARAVYPSLRLFEDSALEILGGSAGLSRVADYNDKLSARRLAKQFASGPMTISALFLLDPEPGSAIRVELVEDSAACMALVEQSFTLDPMNTAAARERLARASALVGAVPIYRLSYPRTYAMLPAVREAILGKLADTGGQP